MDVIPSFYDTRQAGGLDPWNPGFDNSLLRPGEVKRIIYPEDEGSRTRRFVEYDVYVQHRENGTATTKMYHNCILADDLAGLADSSFRTLRVDTPTPASDELEGMLDAGRQKPASSDITAHGYGSKVLILCINAGSADAIIISGFRDDHATDIGRKKNGHHLEWRFNGVELSIKDDGSFSVTKQGPTTPRGDLDSSKAKVEATGTKVEVDKDGSFRVATKDNKQTVVIDQKAGTISVTGDKKMTLHAQTIDFGTKANEQAVLGNTLIGLIGSLIDYINNITMAAPGGTTGPPNNRAQFLALKRKLPTALSKFIKLKKTP